MIANCSGLTRVSVEQDVDVGLDVDVDVGRWMDEW